MVRFVNGLRRACQSLTRNPRYTLLSVGTLGLGIGTATAVFILVNGILLQPLPFPDPDALVTVRSSAPGIGYQDFPLSADYYFRFRDGASAFADMGFYGELPASITGDGDPEDVRAVVASHTLFSTLRQDAILGRTFSSEEDRPGAPAVAVVSFGLWQRRFGGDREAVGSPIIINGEIHEIVGVMGPRFDFPQGVELWIPARYDAETAPWSFSYPTVARLARGSSAEQAQAQLASMMGRIRDSYPEGTSWQALIQDGEYTPLVRGMKEGMVSSLRQPLWLLLGTSGLVLLIACANVANLALIRAEERKQESAVRAALGATQGSLIRLSLTESAVLAGLGGALGFFLAWVILPVVVGHAPPQLPRLSEVGVDGDVVLFALALSGFSVLLFGIPPVPRLSSKGPSPALRLGGRRTTAGPRHQRSQAFLVALQAALALILMVGSGLMARSMWKVYHTDLGFEYDDLLTFRISLPQSRYRTPDQIVAFHDEVLEKLRAIPGVQSAGLTDAAPMADAPRSSPFGLEGMSEGEGQGRNTVLLDLKYVSDGYTETLRIPVLTGTPFDQGEAHNANRPIMVNQALASRFWPDENPIGKQMRYPGDQSNGAWYTVTAVLGTVRERGVREDARPMVHLPLSNPSEEGGWSAPSATYLLRGPNLRSLTGLVHEAVWSVDRDIPLARILPGTDVVADSVVQLSFTMITLGIAALMALFLGAVGLFGALSYTVSRRRQEIAVRMAMGAEQRQVMAMVVGNGVRVASMGILVGLVGAWGLTRVFQGLLYGVEAVDPLTYAGMVIALLLVALLAAYLPARRAASLDPAEAMRED
jgi:predicted permease